VITETPIEQVINTNYFPNDTMIEILQYADIDTFINLCVSSKDIRRLCTNSLWKYKFNQYDIPFNEIYLDFNEWVNLYRQHQHKLKIYKKVDHYLNMIRQNNDDFFTGTERQDAFFTINLQNSLTTNQLINFINQIHFFTINDIQIHNFIFLRKSDYGIDVRYVKRPGFAIKYNVYIGPYTLTPLQFRELLYLLFKTNYLNEKWLYI